MLGVIVGAFAAAIYGREFRWEAYDDAREMKRHVLGAVLMGIGGVTALGRTMGQGLTVYRRCQSVLSGSPLSS